MAFSIDYAWVRDSCGQAGSITNLGACPIVNGIQDSNNNSVDFYFVDTNGTSAGGWKFVSDDNLLLSETPSAIEAWSLRRHFALDEKTLLACGLLKHKTAVGGPVKSDPHKMSFDAHTAFPEGFVQSCFPRVIFFPMIANQPRSRIESLGQRESLPRLLMECPWAAFDVAVARQHQSALSGLVKQCAAYTLHAGLDLLEHPAHISDLLSPYVQRQAVAPEGDVV